jgi:hypothetical protein
VNYWSQNWQLWLSAFCVIAIYSYLYKDNPLYRTMVQIFIGIQVGYNVMVQWKDILYPRWWLPMLDGFDALLFGGPGSPWGAMWAFVGLLGLLWYFQLSRKYLWLSRIVIGVMIGIGAGITFKTQIGTNLPQLTDTFRPLAPAVVGPQPVELYRLPPATAPPAFSERLGVFASNRTVACIEVLNGVGLWSHQLDLVPERLELEDKIEAWSKNEAAVLDLPTGRVQQRLVRVDSQASVIPTPIEYLAETATKSEQKLEEGIVVAMPDREPIAVFREGNTLKAVGRPKEPIWSREFHADSTLFSNFTFIAAEGSVLTGIDLTTGKDTFKLDLKSRITAQPVLAKMKEPTEDRLYAVVPLENGGLAAVVVKDVPALNRQAGEVLWTATLKEPVRYMHAEEGIALLTGPNGGAALELPRPTKNLNWIDYGNNWIFVFTVIAVMTYFFFSFKQTSKPVRWTATYGRWALMVAFGAFFGNTVMTRMSYLLDRLMFLIDEWIKPFLNYLF